jgi:hypothetical protein
MHLHPRTGNPFFFCFVFLFFFVVLMFSTFASTILLLKRIIECNCLKVRDVGHGANWRRDRLTHWQVLQRILESGRPLCPLLEVPWCSVAIFRIDWLHCADQGVTADYLGNLFIMIAGKCVGNNKKERTADLWQRIRAKYAANHVDERLQNLIPTMLQGDGKAPKLRCSAAQCRALVPIAHALAQELLSNAPREAAAKTGMTHLNRCYEALSGDSIFASDVLREHSVRFALQYVALEQTAEGNAWRIKPKLHLFLEICAEGSKPALFWNYRDEDFGGSVSHLRRRRGGLLSAQAFSRNLLERFKIKQPMIRMLCE